MLCESPSLTENCTNWGFVISVCLFACANVVDCIINDKIDSRHCIDIIFVQIVRLI